MVEDKKLQIFSKKMKKCLTFSPQNSPSPKIARQFNKFVRCNQKKNLDKIVNKITNIKKSENISMKKCQSQKFVH